MCPVQLYSKVNTVQEILKYLEKKNNMQNTARTNLLIGQPKTPVEKRKIIVLAHSAFILASNQA